jgi:hypothetical protein
MVRAGGDSKLGKAVARDKRGWKERRSEKRKKKRKEEVWF